MILRMIGISRLGFGYFLAYSCLLIHMLDGNMILMKNNKQNITPRNGDGEKDGYWVMYYNNGELWYKGSYINDVKQGDWFVYFDNGQLWYNGSYINSLKHGDWVWYFSDGQLYYKGSYINGERHGDWERYYYDGKLRYKGSYINGKKIGMWKEWNYNTKEYDNIFYGEYNNLRYAK